MSRKLWSLLIFIQVLFLLGLLTLNRGLLALTIPLIVYILAGYLYRPQGVNLKITRTVEADSIPLGRPVQIKLAIFNEGDKYIEALVEDQVPATLALVEGKSKAYIALSPADTTELTYTVRGSRGIFNFRSLNLITSDPFGLFDKRISYPAEGRFLVMPEVKKLRSIMIRPLRTHGFSGPIPARQGGSGIDFFGVRAYRSGDPIHRINWRVSARYDPVIYTIELERQSIADVGLILDARQQSDVEIQGESLFEHAVQATAALADVFLRDGNRVGLLVYGRAREMTIPGYGKVQRFRILRALARARTGDSLVLESLAYLPTRFFPARSQIVLVSPLLKDDYEVLVQLRAHAYQVLVISPDPISYSEQRLPSQKSLEMAIRMARAERKLLLSKLQRTGIQVVDWQVHDSLDRQIHAAYAHMHTMRRLGI